MVGLKRSPKFSTLVTLKLRFFIDSNYSEKEETSSLIELFSKMTQLNLTILNFSDIFCAYIGAESALEHQKSTIYNFLFMQVSKWLIND